MNEDDRLISAYERGFESGYKKGMANSRQLGILMNPLSTLGLSVRARNILKRANIATIGDLVSCTEESLLMERNCSGTVIDELRQRLASHGLKMVGPPIP